MSNRPPTKLPTPGIARCPSGIRGLDDITEGGLPKGRPTLICGAAGCGMTPRPTLVKKLPRPLRRFIGDMSNIDRIPVGTDVRTAGGDRAAADQAPK